MYVNLGVGEDCCVGVGGVMDLNDFEVVEDVVLNIVVVGVD